MKNRTRSDAVPWPVLLSGTLLCVFGVAAPAAALQQSPAAPVPQSDVRPPDRASDPMMSADWANLARSFSVQDDTDESVLTVSGQAEVEAEPDRARLRFAVETEGATAEVAGRANAALMALVTEAVRDVAEGSEGFRLETYGYSLEPRYGRTQDDRAPQIMGYTARNTLQVTVDDVDQVGPLIDAALDAGANRVSSLNFEVRDPEPYRHEAIREAVEKARYEAEVIASALGMSLGRAVEVQGGADFPIPRPFYPNAARTMELAEQQTPTPIEAGPQTVSANVTIQFRLEPAP